MLFPQYFKIPVFIIIVSTNFIKCFIGQNLFLLRQGLSATNVPLTLYKEEVKRQSMSLSVNTKTWLQQLLKWTVMCPDVLSSLKHNGLIPAFVIQVEVSKC